MILASKSPRRQELLKIITSEFEIVPSELDETSIPADPVEYLAERLARAKATQVAQHHHNEIVIGCDTVVLLDGKVFGKPADSKHAAHMLQLLSGKTHQVVTGVSLVRGHKTVSFSQTTSVSFFKLTEQEIQEYISTGEPFDKAGGYGIQGYGSLLVESICGDFFNVMGLPVARLKKELDIFMNIQ